MNDFRIFRNKGEKFISFKEVKKNTIKEANEDRIQSIFIDSETY